MKMNRSIGFVVGILSIALTATACTPREPARPGGTGQWLDAPTGIVDALPDDVFARALQVAEMCEGGAMSACHEIAYYFEIGAAPLAEAGKYGAPPVSHTIDEDAATYAHGARVPQDEARAVALYDLACEAGFATACVAWAEMAIDARGTDENIDGARVRYEHACRIGMPDACFALAERYRTRTFGGGISEAMHYYHLACSMGLPHACDELRQAAVR